MRQFAAIWLLFSVSSPVLFKTAVFGWYFWNKAEIIATECINRQRPAEHCDGKCYLTKQLQKTDAPAPATGPKLPVKLREKPETSPYLSTAGWRL